MIAVEEAKAQLNIPASDPTHDAEIEAYIAAVTEVVERQVGEVITPRPFTEWHDVCRASSLWLRNHPVLSLTSVARVDGTIVWTVGDLDVDGTTGQVKVRPGVTRLDGLLTVTYQAGYDDPATVPFNWALAARIVVQHLWNTQRGSSGPRMGGDDAFDVGMATVPRDVWMLLGDQPPVVA